MRDGVGRDGVGRNGVRRETEWEMRDVSRSSKGTLFWNALI